MTGRWFQLVDKWFAGLPVVPLYVVPLFGVALLGIIDYQSGDFLPRDVVAT